MTYEIQYSIVLYANYRIEADSEEDALVKAAYLARNYDFRGDVLIPDLDDPYQWGDALSECRTEVMGESDDEPSLTPEQVSGWIG